MGSTTSSARPDHGPGTPHPLLSAAALMAVLLLAALLGFLSRGTTAVQGADAPAADFSAQRAQQQVEAIVHAPRPVGTPANARARSALQETLEQEGFAVSESSGIGAASFDGEAAAGYTTSLVATREGSDPSGTVVLATHLDSVVGAPGAADAGIGLATILESVRAMGPEAARNDLVVLLVDGEEDGLLGARSILEGDASSDLALREPVVVLNHEARGISGRPMVTRTAGPMHEVLGAMPRPEAESFTDALFGIIPNDTDFSVYREHGWWGADMAITGGSWAYHSPQDDAEHLDPRSLQHYGEMTLALSRALLDEDLSALGDVPQERPVTTTAPWGLLTLPPLLVRCIGVLGTFAAAATVLVARRRGAVRARGALGGMGAAALALASGAVLPALLWGGAAALWPQMLSATVGEPVGAVWFLAAEIVLAATATAAVLLVGGRLLRPASLCAGAGALSALLVGVGAATAPALLGWIALPVALALAAALLAALAPRRLSIALAGLGLLPLGWMLGTQTSALGEFGIASSSGMLGGVWALTLLAAAPLLRYDLLRGSPRATADARMPEGSSRGGRSRLWPVLGLCAVCALALEGVGAAASLSSGEPRQERISATVAEDGATTWESSATSTWGRQLAAASGTSDLPAPHVERREGEAGLTELRVSSARQARAIELRTPTGRMTDVTVDGAVVTGGEGIHHLRVVGLAAGQEVTITARLEAGAALEVADLSDDPSAAAGFTPAPADVALVQPSVRVLAPAEEVS